MKREGCVTTHVVRVKGSEKLDCGALAEKQQICIEHGFKVCSISIFPNPASHGTFSLST
jgi:hypothetical protein